MINTILEGDFTTFEKQSLNILSPIINSMRLEYTLSPSKRGYKRHSIRNSLGKLIAGMIIKEEDSPKFGDGPNFYNVDVTIFDERYRDNLSKELEIYEQYFSGKTIRVL